MATNSSGINPTEFKVLILPKPVEEKRGSIIIPTSTQESEKFAQIEGWLVATSHLAFTYVTDAEWGDKRPKPGDAILFGKYAGVRVKGKDGKEYIIANDKDVVATIEE
jgi:co-chaperonin GroES (HSP10)